MESTTATNLFSIIEERISENGNFSLLENITLQDDAFHKTYDFFHIETWYFDGVFDNNYSMVFVITVVQKGNRGFVLISFSLYQDSDLIVFSREMSLLRHLSISENKPFLKLCNIFNLTGDVDYVTNNWVYDFLLEIDELVVNLHFVNITKGWKTDIRGGWWLVVPSLNVTGWILLNGENISIFGNGFHDHNWFYIFTPFIQKGWHYVSLEGNLLGITWAKVMKNRFTGEVIAVLNQKDMNPLLINPDEVTLLINEYMFTHGRLIPKNYSLKIENERLLVDVRMETLNIHYIKLPLMNYWRYHIRVKGIISLDQISEEVNTVKISELMKFF